MTLTLPSAPLCSAGANPCFGRPHPVVLPGHSVWAVLPARGISLLGLQDFFFLREGSHLCRDDRHGPSRTSSPTAMWAAWARAWRPNSRGGAAADYLVSVRLPHLANHGAPLFCAVRGVACFDSTYGSTGALFAPASQAARACPFFFGKLIDPLRHSLPRVPHCVTVRLALDVWRGQSPARLVSLWLPRLLSEAHTDSFTTDGEGASNMCTPH